MTTAFLFMTSELPHKPWLFYWAPDKTFNLPSQHPCPGISCRHLRCSLSNTEFIPQVSAELLLLCFWLSETRRSSWKAWISCENQGMTLPPEGLRIPPWVPTAFESWSNTYSSFTAYHPTVVIPTKVLLCKSHGDKLLSGLVTLSYCLLTYPRLQDPFSQVSFHLSNLKKIPFQKVKVEDNLNVLLFFNHQMASCHFLRVQAYPFLILSAQNIAFKAFSFTLLFHTF